MSSTHILPAQVLLGSCAAAREKAAQPLPLAAEAVHKVEYIFVQLSPNKVSSRPVVVPKESVPHQGLQHPACTDPKDHSLLLRNASPTADRQNHS